MIRIVALTTACLCLAAVSAGQGSGWTDISGHTVSLVPVAPDVSLEVLDWGGGGPPLVLLAGLGNTAHVFDHFAHQFTDSFHVIGITRRGFGSSTHAEAGYDIAARAHDIVAVADYLKLDRIVFVGHSIAGDELTKFAEVYPTRVLALVYIDAAYDRTKVVDLPQPAYPAPPRDALASGERYMAYLARVWNWRAPEAEMYNTRFIGADGSVGEPKTSPRIIQEIVKRISPPNYKTVAAPALALYARPNLRVVYPYFDDLDADSQSRAERIVETTRSYIEGAIAGFQAGAENRKTVILDGNHYLFFTNEAEVVRLMRQFLTPLSRSSAP